MDTDNALDRRRGAALVAATAGGNSALARDVGITQQAVDLWRRRGVPVMRVLDLERRYGIPRWAIRSDVYPPPDDDPRARKRRDP